MERLSLLPEEGSYKYEPAVQHGRVQHSGPSGLYAATIPNTTLRVECEWLLDEETVEEFIPFYNRHADYAIPFLIALITKRNELVDHVAFFDPNTFVLKANGGQVYVITSTLQVQEA